MEKFQLIDHIQTAIAVIDHDLTVVDANHAYRQRAANRLHLCQSKCYEAAYDFCCPCQQNDHALCPVKESFSSKQPATTTHHYWIKDHAVVEEIIATPVIEDNGEVHYVVEEFHDLSNLLGLDKGIITVCAYCQKVKTSDQKWMSLEAYLTQHTSVNFSHGICESCKEKQFLQHVNHEPDQN